MQEQFLRLNRESGKYELTFKISVDAEIFQRDLFTYAQHNHIDPTNPEEWQKAIAHVTRADKWLNHPHAVVLTSTSQPAPVMPVATTPKPSPAVSPEVKGLTNKKLTVADAKALREKAIDTPLDNWDSLLTPIPVGYKEKNPYYQRRYAERDVLAKLKQDLETPVQPLNFQRVEAIAAVVNGNGHK